MKESEKKSWHGKVGYSIVTPSYADSNYDGIGDIAGVESKLPYLQTLGIDIVHLTPFYPTHLYDIGYDVDSYDDIDPRYGDKETFKQFIDKAHSLGIAVVSDLVINHTSIHHSWFKEAMSSRENPQRDWYIWRDAKEDGSPPNNWVANFSGSAWEFEETSGQYFLHTFLPEQPDLNYENPEVRKAMIASMKQWVDLGIDGFRLDSLPFIIKAQGLPDAEPNPHYTEGLDHPNTKVINRHWWYQPEMLGDLQALCEATDAFIFSESNPPESLKDWRKKIYDAAPSDNHAMINSTLNGMPWDADRVMDHLEEFYGMIESDGIASYQTSCHDVYQRTVNRIREEQARNAALLLLALPGIPWIYYGDEIGMKSESIPYNSTNPFQTHTFRRFGYDRTKDPARLAMPWDSSAYAGFSTYEPVMSIPTDYKTRNVASQIADPNSFYHFHKDILALRSDSLSMQQGRFERIDPGNSHVGAFQLTHEKEMNGVIINFTAEEQQITLPLKKARIIMRTNIPGQKSKDEIGDKYTLLPHEGVLFQK